MIDKTEFTKSMKYLTESARISSAYGMILNESRERAFDGRTVQKTVTTRMCESWNKPKVDLERLSAAIETVKGSNNSDICPPAETFGSVKEKGVPSFDAYVDDNGNIVLSEGLKMVDGDRHGEGHWIQGMHRGSYDASIDGFMTLLSRAYADSSEDGDEVLEWKLKDVVQNGDDRSYSKYIMTVSPYYIDWSNEYLGKDGKVVKRDGRFDESEKKCCEGDKESVMFTIQRFKEDADGNDIKKFKMKKYSSKNTREDIAEWFSEKYDEDGSVMNTKVDDDTYVATIPTDDGYDKYILKFLKDVKECGGSKKVEESDDAERSKKVFYLDIRVPHGETEDDETFEDMKYAGDYSLLKDAVDKAKEAYAEYVKDHPEVEVNIWGGEERRPTGDVYGEPWVYCTVKGDGCDFSDEEIAEEDAHDDYFLWRSEEVERGDADVKESEELEDEATIGNIDDMEDVEETEMLTPEARKMVERDSVGWSNFGSNMPDNHVAFKNRLVVSSSYNNGIVGQSNLIAALKRLEDAGFKSGSDFGVLSAGGFGGHAYYLWYDRDNVKLANMLSGIEKELEDYVLLDEDLHSTMDLYLCDWYWNDADEGTKAEYYEKHGEKVPDVRPIPKPEFYNDNGDVTAMTAEQTLSDPELRKMAEEYAIELPESYFE